MIVRFVGRFVFALESADVKAGVGKCGRLHALGIDMQHNPVLNVDPHHLVLSIPRIAIASDNPRPDLSVVSTATDLADIRQHAVWNLARTTVSLGRDAMPGPVTVKLPNVRELEGHVTPAAMLPTPTGTAASCRFSIEHGTFEEFFIDPPGRRSRFGFAPYRAIARPTEGTELPIGVEATFRVANPSLELRGFGGSSLTIVRLVEPPDGGPIICTISNLCGEIGIQGPRDTEFAALYEVLHTPPPLLDRPVPVRVLAKSGGLACVPSAIAPI